jgi:16S rRNA (cytidine1402-2'-O)-methyltransferase
MPGISDPGEDLVKIARTNGIKVICIPGPCAALTALVSSGLPSSKFTFEGFLPKKKSERAKILLQISKSEKTSILFEAPNRLIKLLNELRDFCGEEREIVVSRELTKKFEETIGNNIHEVINYFDAKQVLGEITILVKGTSKKKYPFEFNEYELKNELNDLINAGLSLSNASKYLAKKTSLTKSTIYNIYENKKN